ncbi:MAG: DEAD/DEAH box helicase [Deltaproteobacteria bacterium]|nr:DEAD/DEAH box helicase [Deltaproteobacteria bacterium]MBW2133366.1 DEAD/DEAH box helicase [Deltaproteobacteria bacterium]
MVHRKRFPEKRRWKRRKKTPAVHIRPEADARLKKVFAEIGVPEQIPFTPDAFQLEAVEAIRRYDCLVTAPTGAGKTWIATETISEFLNKGKRAWYASPLKALSNAKYVEFSELFGPETVGILTGDRKENPEAPVIVGTTEILRNQLYDAMHRGESLNADFVVLDEAHFLGDADRGVVWEEILIYLPPRIPILMLSATVGNAEEIAGWLSAIRLKKCVVVKETRRPVPLYPLFFHPSGRLFPLLSESGTGARKKSRLHKKVAEYAAMPHPPRLAPPNRLPPFGAILRVLRKYKLLPAIFFLKSRSDCDTALDLCTENPIQNEARKAAVSRKIEEICAASQRIARHRQLWQLEHLGVGSHHSGQLPAWKLVVEKMMTEGLLDAVFATSTVAAGVNFPARTVVFLNSDRFNGREFLPMTPTEFHQMTGRAGRRGMDRIGFAVALPGKFMDLKLIADLIDQAPTDVASQIKINFSMVLNLLLSHTPEQIEGLLAKSLAAYQIGEWAQRHSGGRPQANPSKILWRDFMRHLSFLAETGFVDPEGRLTHDGQWASRLRVDQPLLIAEGFRQNLFPETDPALLAAVTSVFVFEGESEGDIPRKEVPRRLEKAFAALAEGLSPFVEKMAKRRFFANPPRITPAFTLYLWASGQPWETVLKKTGMAEGDLAMLILRTVDNLRHVAALEEVFPDAAATALNAIDLLMRDPVIVEELEPEPLQDLD